mgnify:CR=1 FL=1
MLCSRDARCRCKSSLSALIYRSSISRNSKRARCVRYASQRSMPFVVRLIARLAIFLNFVLTPPNQRSKDAKIGGAQQISRLRRSFLAVRFNFSSKVVRCGTKRKSLGWDILGVFPIRGSKVWCRRLRLFTRKRLSLGL